jgi:ElaB/YqjD/DUF883 family membrane-anchored ribosome-binding protein
MSQYTPFDLFQAAMNQKQAVDALVPGQVGYGANPGTLGSLDSDPMQASNTDISLLRSQQSAAPIISRPDADGGAGYSHPAPGVSPSMQMFADVKAASIIEEARQYAEAVYFQAKTAGRVGAALDAAKNVAGNVAAGARNLGAQAQPHLDRARAGAQGLAQGAQEAYGAAGSALNGARIQVANNPYVGNMAGAMGIHSTPMESAGYHMSNAMDAVGQMAGQAKQKAMAGMASTQARVQQGFGQAQQAASNAASYVQQGAQNAADAGAAAASQHPMAAMGIGAASLAAAGGGGVLGGQVMAARQAEASKNASLNEAAEMGRLFALQQMGYNVC